MRQHDQDQAEDLNKIASKTGDYVLTGLVQGTSLIIGSLMGASPLQSAKLGQLLYKNLGLIVGITVTPFLIVALMVMSIQNQERSNVNLGSEATNLDGIDTVVLNVPYFNQWLDPDGSVSPIFPKRRIRGSDWDLGQVLCGAASVTMVAGYFGKLPYDINNENDLKKFSYTDQGLNLPSKCASREIGGAFGMTAYDSSCNMSGYGGMVSYLNRMNLRANNIGVITFEKVKRSIDAGNPLIVSMSAPVGHIAVIKGYTADGRLVMNDPYKDVQSSTAGYSYNGKNALYQVNTGWTVNYIMEISQ
jgi:hypothetical protein